jgi:hypothetical protein
LFSEKLFKFSKTTKKKKKKQKTSKNNSGVLKSCVFLVVDHSSPVYHDGQKLTHYFIQKNMIVDADRYLFFLCSHPSPDITTICYICEHMNVHYMRWLFIRHSHLVTLLKKKKTHSVVSFSPVARDNEDLNLSLLVDLLIGKYIERILQGPLG